MEHGVGFVSYERRLYRYVDVRSVVPTQITYANFEPGNPIERLRLLSVAKEYFGPQRYQWFEDSMIGLRTLVLNADMSPISLFPLHTIPAEDAVTRIHNATCFVVAEYDRQIKTPTAVMNWPSVIARRQYAHFEKYAVLNKETLYYRDHAMCAYCGQDLTVSSVTIDHVIPQSANGPHVWKNVVAACSRCNSHKGDAPPSGKWKPARAPFHPTYYQLLERRRRFPITIDHPSWLDYIGPWEGEVKIRNTE